MSVDLESVREHVERLQWAKSRMSELKIVEEESRAAVEEAMGTEELGYLTDGDTNVPAIRWKHGKQRRLDQKELAAKYPQIKELLTVTTATRRFEVL